MESLFDNRPLLYSLAGAGGFVVMLALGKKLTIASSKYLFSFFCQGGYQSSAISSALSTSLMSTDQF